MAEKPGLSALGMSVSVAGAVSEDVGPAVHKLHS